MLNIIRVILFVLVNIAGWYTIQIIYILATKYGLNPELPVAHIEFFRWWYFYVALWVWMGCAIISIGYFFTRDELKNWLLLSPMYVTAIYCTGTLIYFNFFYRVV
jgi:hypothetical protein